MLYENIIGIKKAYKGYTYIHTYIYIYIYVCVCVCFQKKFSNPDKTAYDVTTDLLWAS